MSDAEKEMIDDIARSNVQGSVRKARSKVNARRAKRGEEPLSRSPVYRYIKGMTHKRTRREKRGQKPVVTKAILRDLQKARRRLVKEADS